MTKLRECICRSLRVNDIFSRYSVSQYVLMLSDTDYENGERIMKRILEQYKKKTRNQKPSSAINIKAFGTIQPISAKK